MTQRKQMPFREGEMEPSQLVHGCDRFSDMSKEWTTSLSTSWRKSHERKDQVASPTIVLEGPETFLRHLISLLTHDVFYPEHKLYLDEYGPEATIQEILGAITPDFQDLHNSQGNCYDIQRSAALLSYSH